MDNNTSIGMLILIAHDLLPIICKDIFAGIIAKHLDTLERLVKVNPVLPFNDKETPIKAQGRTALKDTTIKSGDATIHLYSWSKMFV